jgi:prepilin signal peptidase PulO-like enzyme (type II secretory pathway)
MAGHRAHSGSFGSSGGEIIGGVWILLLSAAALRTKVFPVALNWLGVGIGIAGILSLAPALNGLAVVFGLLQIVWFAWLGIVMLRTRPDEAA